MIAGVGIAVWRLLPHVCPFSTPKGAGTTLRTELMRAAAEEYISRWRTIHREISRNSMSGLLSVSAFECTPSESGILTFQEGRIFQEDGERYLSLSLRV